MSNDSGGLGALLGDLLAEGDRSRTRRSLRDARDLLLNTNVEAGPNAYDAIRSDPRLRMAQMSALDQLQREGQAGGMGLQDRVALNQAANETARRERGTRQAILQRMAMRGAGGSGTELAANLANQQGAAESNAMSGAQAAADARRRALGAISQSGNLAGGIRGQDWGEASERANAQNALERFNASQRLNRAQDVAGVYGSMANNYTDEAERWRKRGQNIAGSVADAASFFGSPKSPSGVSSAEYPDY